MRHQVTRQLTRFYNVLYVELSPHPGDACEEWQALDESVLIFRPPRSGKLGRKLRSHLEYCQRSEGRRLACRVDRAIEELGYERAVLVNFQFDLPEIMQLPRFVTKLYLCNDDFQSGHRWWTRAMHRRAEAAVIAAADACFAVSPPLLEMLRKSATRAELFLPGHEFAPCARNSLRKRERPIRVCYMGFVNARLRVDWLADLARQPQIELTLVGPIEEPQHSAELFAVRAVRHIGALTGEQLQAELQAADVLVMPYDTRQAAVRAISAPNKLFQYLACGRPVVCSDLPSLMQLPRGFLYVAANSAQFTAAVNTAFDEDTEALAAKRLDFAASNSWRSRGDRLQQVIQEATACAG